MDLQTFQQHLIEHESEQLAFRFQGSADATPRYLPAHFHITEVGKVTKQFVDCGGTQRTTTSCVLQTLVANDVDHRLQAGKLAKIMTQTEVLGLATDLPMEVEVQADTIGVYEIAGRVPSEHQLVFELRPKQTACLAPDRCGLDILSNDAECCGDTGCC